MVEKTLDIRIRAVMGEEFAKLQRTLESIGMVGTKAGRSGKQAGHDMAGGFKRANDEGRNLNHTIENSTRYLQLLKGVISAFLLYKGFSFLTQQANQFARTLVDVQHEIGIIQTQLNATGKDYRSLVTQNIMRIASETGIAMETLAKAEYQVVSANIEVSKSFKVLELSAKAALAGGLKDVDLAFNAALSQVNVFGETFEDVYDKQFQVLKRGIFTYEQFATVVGTLSEAFASMGQDIETANASLAAISQVFTGSQLERGATGLRNAVLRISEAPEDFKALGIAVTDANGEFRNFLNIAQDLKAILDGMSSSARANVIRKLFPDERERRGIGAFLNQLDSAEQFFVEQQFAVDSLNEAYETANDSLKVQADMFRNDLIPAMQPFVDMAGGLLAIFNGMDDMLPGLNKNLLTTATIGAVIGSTMLMSGGRLGLRRTMPFQGPLAPGQESMGTYRGRPTGFGWATAGLIGTSLIAGAAQPGAARPGDFIGAAIAGGATGAMIGGATGAATGAVAGMLAVALGDALGDRSGPAVSFAEAFAEALKERSASIGEALASALEKASEDQVLSGLERYKALAGQGELEKQFRPSAQPSVSMGFTEEDERVILAELRQKGRVRVSSDRGDFSLESEEGARSFFNRYRPGSFEFTITRELTEEMRKGIDAALLARQEVMENEQTIRLAAKAEKVPYEELNKVILESAITNALQEVLPGNAIAQNLVTSILGEDFDMTRVEEFFSILDTRGVDAAINFVVGLEDAGRNIGPTFETIAASFNRLFTGDANTVADVFEHMGQEGENLAEIFRRIGQTVQAFGTLEAMQKFEFVNPKIEARKESTIAKLAEYRQEVARLESFVGPMMPEQERGFHSRLNAFKQAISALETRMERLNAMPKTNILESLGIDSMQAGEMLTDRLLEDIGLVKGNFSTQDFVNALLAEAAPTETFKDLQLASNSFADALFQASDLVREGLMDGMGRTADQLEMLGEEFQLLNRFVRQRSLLEELRGIAEFAGVGTGGIVGAMDILRQQMVASGKALFDILGDPASLAELIAKMEFGDIEVDNSTNMQITVRVEGGASDDPALLARIADGILANLNNKARARGI